MKRYVVEFANDVIRTAMSVKCNRAIAEADRITRACERGYITDFEAVKALTMIKMGEEE